MTYEKKNKDQRSIAKVVGIAIMAVVTIMSYVFAYLFISSDKFFTLYGIWFDFQQNMVKFFVPMIGILFSIALYAVWFNSVINDNTSILFLDDDKKKTIGYGWQYWAIGSALGGILISIIALLLCRVSIPFISPTFIVVWIAQAISVFIAFAWKISNPLNKIKD